MENPTGSPFAGFWRRLAAYLIDTVLLAILSVLLILALAVTGASSSGPGAVAEILLPAALFLLYFVLFESSSWQATPGKRLLGAQVAALSGERISFIRALGRNVAKYVLLILSFLLIFSRGKQALHDRLAQTVVLRQGATVDGLAVAPRRSALRAALWVPVAALFLLGAVAPSTRLLFRSFKVDGNAMYPTLRSGDYILVDKLGYNAGSAGRGDIIVFDATPAHSPGKDFIKRVVGLPGETIAIRGGAIYIDSRKLDESYIAPAQRPTYTYSPTVVPPGDYFVLGDNRNDSYDSHLWGFLPRKYIISKVALSYWPLSDFSLL